MENLNKSLANLELNTSEISKQNLDELKSRILLIDEEIEKVSDLDNSELELVKSKFNKLSVNLDIINNNFDIEKSNIILYIKGLLSDLKDDINSYQSGKTNDNKLFSTESFIDSNKIIIDNTEGYFDNGDFFENINKYSKKPFFNELLGIISIDLVSYYEKHGDFIVNMKYNQKYKDIYSKYLGEDKLFNSALLKHNKNSIIDQIDFYKKYLSVDNFKKILLLVDDNQFFGTDYVKNKDDYRYDHNIDLYEETFGMDFIKSSDFKMILLKSIESSKGDYNSYSINDILRIKDKCGFDNDFLFNIAKIKPKLFLSNFIFKVGDINLVKNLLNTAIQSNLSRAIINKNNLLDRKNRGYKSFFNKKHRQQELLDLYNEFIPKAVAIDNLDNQTLVENKELVNDYSNQIRDKSLICRDGRFINLGIGYEKIKKYFQKDKEFKGFVEKQLLNNTIDISQSINDIYDFYEEKEGEYNYQLGLLKDAKVSGSSTRIIERNISTLKNELGSKLPIDIKKEIREGLKNYSTEEIISALGNHVTNYSTTFKLMLNELDGRFKSGENIITFIESNNNLNFDTKKFLLGQTIVGLLARGKVEKINIMLDSINDKNLLGGIIEEIIDHKNNELFSKESFSGLLIGLTSLLEKNSFIKNKIKNIFNSNINTSFNLGLYTVLRISDKTNLLKEIIGNDYKKGELNDKYNDLIKYAEFPNDIHEKYIEGKSNDIVMIYGGGGTGGGKERYSLDISKFKKMGYTFLDQGDNLNTLEKNGIKVTFINYDKLDNKNIKDISSFLLNKGINPKLVAYRGHNYYTSKMIKNTGGYGENNVIIDGGCRNISKLATYRKQGISNQILAYNSTGQGDDTLSVITQYIKYIRDVRINPEKQKSIKTWDNFRKKYGGSEYAKEHIKFPGSMIDILGRIGI